MKPKQMNDYLMKRVEYWRRRLGIDPDLELTVKFVTGHEHNGESPYAEVFLDSIHYGRCTIYIYERVFQEPDFKRAADCTIFHELLHIALNDLTSFCANMFADDDGKRKELERLEESFITKMERAFAGHDGD